MEIITERGRTFDECVQKLNELYGEGRVKIQKTQKIMTGGFLGLGAKPGVEVSGYLANINPPLQTQPKLLNFEAEREKILAKTVKPDMGWQTVMKSLEDLGEKIENIAVPQREYPAITRLEEILELNDFSPQFTKKILERVRYESTIEDLEDYDALQEKVLQWIGESIDIYNDQRSPHRPRIVILVGPTGIGKTTTLAKLAAQFAVVDDRNSLKVRLISIDNYRIGGAQQTKTYGEIMEIPSACVETPGDLKKTIELFSDDVDIIFVDTIGRSPTAAVEIARMKEYLSVCGPNAEYHLAIAAATKSSDIRDIMEQFEPFGCRSVVITKLDETRRTGNLISALADKGKAISYITTGQQVPGDIEKASVIQLLLKLEGFEVKKDQIEERFASGVTC
jgi:flagellar biosynthesis protein FlhF